MAQKSSTPFEKTRNAFWALLLVVILAALGYAFALHELRITNAANASLTKQNNTIVEEESQIDTVRKGLEQTDARRATLTSYFVDAGNVVPFLETVEGYGKTVNASTSFTTVQMQKDPTYLKVTVTARGSFQSIYRFIGMLEAAPYETAIQGVDIRQVLPDGLQSEQAATQSTNWDATATVYVYSISGNAQ